MLTLIQEYIPQLIIGFSIEAQYRLRLARAAVSVSEAPVAFETSEDVRLDRIYVEATASTTDSTLLQLGMAVTDTESLTVDVPPDHAEAFDRLFASWAQRQGSLILEQPSRKRRKVGKSKSPVRVNLDPLFAAIRDHARSCVEEILAANDQHKDSTFVTDVIERVRGVVQELRRLSAEPAIQPFWRRLLGVPASTPESIVFSAAALTSARQHLFVLGRPGSGKTTLLRKITQSIAEQTSEVLPIFIPLVLLETPSLAGLVRACNKQLSAFGYERSELEGLLQSGKQVCMCLDGLDETGGMAKPTLSAVEHFAEQHPNVRVILSTREVVSPEDWPRAFAVRLSAFSDDQLRAFINNWFTALPSSSDGLLKWLEVNKGMRETARTPLIAALLCSLYRVDAEMPHTEVELYQKRFELLLGRWEKAKNIPSMSGVVRQRYLHFLRFLAFTMHKAGRRAISREDAIEIARRYCSETLHIEPEMLLQDCIHRGVLERERAEQLSLGHLTYQEFLAAEYLADLNPIQEIWKALLQPWWKKTFEFYAGIKLDVSPLIALGLKAGVARVLFDQLENLASYAPLTRPDMIEALRRRVDGRAPM